MMQKRLEWAFLAYKRVVWIDDLSNYFLQRHKEITKAPREAGHKWLDEEFGLSGDVGDEDDAFNRDNAVVGGGIVDVDHNFVEAVSSPGGAFGRGEFQGFGAGGEGRDFLLGGFADLDGHFGIAIGFDVNLGAFVILVIAGRNEIDLDRIDSVFVGVEGLNIGPGVAFARDGRGLAAELHERPFAVVVGAAGDFIFISIGPNVGIVGVVGGRSLEVSNDFDGYGTGFHGFNDDFGRASDDGVVDAFDGLNGHAIDFDAGDFVARIGFDGEFEFVAVREVACFYAGNGGIFSRDGDGGDAVLAGEDGDVVVFSLLEVEAPLGLGGFEVVLDGDDVVDVDHAFDAFDGDAAGDVDGLGRIFEVSDGEIVVAKALTIGGFGDFATDGDHLGGVDVGARIERDDEVGVMEKRRDANRGFGGAVIESDAGDNAGIGFDVFAAGIHADGGGGDAGFANAHDGHFAVFVNGGDFFVAGFPGDVADEAIAFAGDGRDEISGMADGINDGHVIEGDASDGIGRRDDFDSEGIGDEIAPSGGDFGGAVTDGGHEAVFVDGRDISVGRSPFEDGFGEGDASEGGVDLEGAFEFALGVDLVGVGAKGDAGDADGSLFDFVDVEGAISILGVPAEVTAEVVGDAFFERDAGEVGGVGEGFDRPRGFLIIGEEAGEAATLVHRGGQFDVFELEVPLVRDGFDLFLFDVFDVIGEVDAVELDGVIDKRSGRGFASHLDDRGAFADFADGGVVEAGRAADLDVVAFLDAVGESGVDEDRAGRVFEDEGAVDDSRNDAAELDFLLVHILALEFRNALEFGFGDDDSEGVGLVHVLEGDGGFAAADRLAEEAVDGDRCGIGILDFDLVIEEEFLDVLLDAVNGDFEADFAVGATDFPFGGQLIFVGDFDLINIGFRRRGFRFRFGRWLGCRFGGRLRFGLRRGFRFRFGGRFGLRLGRRLRCGFGRRFYGWIFGSGLRRRFRRGFRFARRRGARGRGRAGSGRRRSGGRRGRRASSRASLGRRSNGFPARSQSE